MTLWVLEIDAPPTIVVIDLTPLRLGRIGPIGQPAVANATKDLIEFGLADQEGVVLVGNLAFDIHEVDVRSVIGP